MKEWPIISVAERRHRDKKISKGKFFTSKTQADKFWLNFLCNMNQSFACITKLKNHVDKLRSSY